MKTSLYFQDDRSDKVYVIETVPQLHVADRFQVIAAWGRRGGTLQTGVKADMLRSDEAEQWHQQLVKEKLAKGYWTNGVDGPSVQRPSEIKAPASVKSNEVPALMLLNEVDVQTAESLLSDDRWILQPKFDGVRVLLTRNGFQVSGISRQNKPVALPKEVVDSAIQYAIAGRARSETAFVIDGELIGETFIVFDILVLNGADLWKETAAHRATTVTQIFGKKQTAILPILTAYGTREKRALYRSVFERGMEGVVLKKANAAYSPGRPNSGGPALKYKFVNTASVICTGQHGNKSSFEMALADGSGIGTCTVPPNKTMPEPGSVVEVRTLYRHSVNGKLIQPVFLRIREDVDPSDCTADQFHVKGQPRK